MKDKLIFKKNLPTVTIICLIVAVLEIALLIYITYNFIEAEKRLAMCIFIPVVPGLLFLLFSRYLKVNSQTVTFCVLFKRKQIINWKDATVTKIYKNANGSVSPTVVIKNGTQEISFASVSDKDFALLEQLCKAAREQSNTDNLTF